MPAPKKTTEKSKSAVRPPVVVVMGHIDHGKSTLLDYIRKSNIVEGEAGGITQHLGAYEVEHKSTDEKGTGKNVVTSKITFLDTPGHEAFAAIRERGAHVADIAILVVSAEDGVKPQTLEALKSIKEEKLPYIVAINKIDKPGANVDRTKVNLAENEIYVEGYGGDISFVPISALTGEGIPELLDMIMLTAEIGDLKADHAARAEGAVIEAHLDNKKGITATLLIKNGTLHAGTFVVAEDSYCPVRILQDYSGKPIQSATFSSPVGLAGWSKLPPVGSPFIVVDTKKEAEELIKNFKPTKSGNNKLDGSASSGPGNSNQNKLLLPFIIKTDAVGSLDGIRHELAKIKNDKVGVKIVIEGVGAVSESDVKTAQGDSSITILAFNAKPDKLAKSLLERATTEAPINIREFKIIYELIEYVKNVVAENIPKEYSDETTGKAKILAVFSKVKDRQILGGKVQEGEISTGEEVKILRRDVEIGRGKIRELQQQKVKTSEVREGYEFGTLVESKIEIAVGDKLECFKVVEKK